MEIHSLTADEMLRNYHSKILSPVEVVQTLFQRIDVMNPKINAFVTLNKEEAFIEAKEAEKRFYTGENIRPLEGVPIAIKDLVNTKGIRTTYGCLVYQDHIPDRDATVFKRLKEAGAILLGKTNTPEFGYKGTTNNPLFGPSRNPWNLNKQTGGSSGGSAAAVTAGFVPFAQGGDAGGSIRIPSALCGVYGFKPSFGRIPYDNDLQNVFGNHNPFIHYGPIARSVSDAALMFDIIQGDAPTDPFSLPKLEFSVYERLKHKFRSEFRIGYTLDFGIFEVDEELKVTFLQTLEQFRKWGVHVDLVDIHMKKTAQEYYKFFEKVWTTHLCSGLTPLLTQHGDQLSEDLKDKIHIAEKLSAVHFESLGEYRSYLWLMMQSLFQTYDVILSPTVVSVDVQFNEGRPKSINGHATKQGFEYLSLITSIFNLTGQPACSIPIGFTASGTPIGMQAVCQRLDDVTLFQFAKWVEDHLQIPTLADLS